MPDFSVELRAHLNGSRIVCGIDEAGRGPWAGPVVSAAVILDQSKLNLEILNLIDDSKKLGNQKRLKVFDLLTPVCIWAIGIATVTEIDQKNIVEATLLSMRRAVSKLSQDIDLALVDGNLDPIIEGVNTKCIVKGDSKSYSIAAASILAKVSRDKIMKDLAKEYPGYGWETNAGYGTKKHQEALRNFGVNPEHRKSFLPIRNILGFE